jgi:hypothetical protein
MCASFFFSVAIFVQSEKLEIMRARAAASIQQGRLHLAAIYYAQSGLSFDEVALTLLHCVSDASAAAAIGLTPPSSAVALAAVNTGSAGASTQLTIAGPEGTTGTSGSSLAPLVDSNLSYFTDAPVKSASPAAPLSGPSAYSRVSYTSASLVDAAIVKGCALTPLKVFLLQVLRSLASSAKMQRTMLCTWLCDLYLHQISLARLLSAQGSAGQAGSSAVGGASSANSAAAGGVGAAVAEYEAMVKSDDLLDEADLTTQFKNFLRSNRCDFTLVRALSAFIPAKKTKNAA